MYGASGCYGPMGPAAPGEYGAVYANPLPAIAWGAVALWSAVGATAVIGGGYLYSKGQAEAEAARHTGGFINGRPADEVHTDYCATLPKTDPMWQEDASGRSFCGSTPSGDALAAADIPDGFWEGVQETFGGYEYRISAECKENPNLQKCIDTGQGPKTPIPTWVWVAGVGVVAAMLLMPERKKA